jgi:uncharacterized protein YigE (DUF2233 family)
MKYILGIIILCILVYVLRPATPPPINPIVPSPTPTEAPKGVSLDNQLFTYAIIQTKAQQIQLLPNFIKRDTSQTIIESNVCQSAINGGFYDTDNQPLGFFRSQNETLRAASKNSLLNGFFSIDQNNIVSIGSDVPSDTARIALQTGPIVSNGTLLKINNDEHARRMVVATDENGNIFFITVYGSESVFGGPLLGDLPEFIQQISSQESLHITSAINLDGGSASFFYSPETKLSELTPVGSIFCIKNE